MEHALEIAARLVWPQCEGKIIQLIRQFARRSGNRAQLAIGDAISDAWCNWPRTVEKAVDLERACRAAAWYGLARALRGDKLPIDAAQADLDYRRAVAPLPDDMPAPLREECEELPELAAIVRSLTTRQEEIARRLARGENQREIASALGASNTGVYREVEIIRAKLNYLLDTPNRERRRAMASNSFPRRQSRGTAARNDDGNGAGKPSYARVGPRSAYIAWWAHHADDRPISRDTFAPSKRVEFLWR